MREIKFRGKRIDTGEWVYGYLFQSKYGTSILVNRDDRDLDKGWYYPNDVFECLLVEPETVGQYSGRKDRNGIEIYEGDIVKQTFHAEVRDGQGEWISFDGHHIGEIVITATKGVCMKNPLCYSGETGETTRSNQYKSVAGYRCEVIGHIYKQKENRT